MNPQFCRTASDRNSARNEYIKNLQLETSNNLMNYNANQVFKQTGVLPPSITALLDTRSITEKYADTQKARVAVLSGLREITDGANANQIVSQIQSKDMITLLNNLPQIITEIKPKWSLGITAPAFMGYWDNYKKAIALNSGVSAYPIIQSNQLLTNIEGLLQNIQATLPTQQDYSLMKSVFKLLPQTEQVQLADQIIEDAMIQADEIRNVAKEISQMTQEDPIILENMLKQVQTAVENSTPKNVIVNLTQQAQIVSQLGNSPQEANELATQATTQLSLENPISFRTLQKGLIPKEFIEESNTPSSTPTSSPMTTVASESTQEQTGRNPRPQIQLDIRPPRNMEEFQRLPLLDKRAFVIFIKRNDPEFLKKLDLSQMRDSSRKVESIIFDPKNSDSPNYYTNTNVMELLTDFFNSKGELKATTKTKGVLNTYENILRNYYGGKPTQKIGLKSVLSGAQESKSSGTEPPLEPTPEDIKKGTTGSGIKKKHRIQGKGVNSHRTHAPTTNLTSGGNYYQKPKIDTSHKVEKVPSYIEFGKHVLHQHNLQGGILQIRRHSGTIINDLPRQAVGGKLKKVLITLTGTGNPSFEDINELSDSEKNLLNKVVKHCKIDQRLLVPTPNKSKEEQDFNRLQILSGEITAGNNNPQIVKELKTILLRLKNCGRIPKKHAHEIMEDLLSLGY
jgi:hypothetical protein